MYPDDVLFGLVRDPIASYKSHRRNKPSASVSLETFVAFWEMINKVHTGADH